MTDAFNMVITIIVIEIKIESIYFLFEELRGFGINF